MTIDQLHEINFAKKWIFGFKSKPEWRVPHPETLQLPEDSCIIVGIGTGWGGVGDCGDHGDRSDRGDHGDRGDGIVIVVIMVIMVIAW